MTILFIVLIVICIVSIFINMNFYKNIKQLRTYKFYNKDLITSLPTIIDCYFVNNSKNTITNCKFNLMYLHDTFNTKVYIDNDYFKYSKRECMFFKSGDKGVFRFEFVHEITLKDINEDLLWVELNKVNIFKDKYQATESQLEFLTNKMKQL